MPEFVGKSESGNYWRRVKARPLFEWLCGRTRWFEAEVVAALIAKAANGVSSEVAAWVQK